jgi:hypothetical protein
LGFPNAFQFSHQSKRHGLLAEILLIAPAQAKLALSYILPATPAQDKLTLHSLALNC